MDNFALIHLHLIEGDMYCERVNILYITRRRIFIFFTTMYNKYSGDCTVRLTGNRLQLFLASASVTQLAKPNFIYKFLMVRCNHRENMWGAHSCGSNTGASCVVSHCNSPAIEGLLDFNQQNKKNKTTIFAIKFSSVWLLHLMCFVLY